jgi:hypothetical protein
MRIEEATRRYERWLGRCTPLLRRDLALKHRAMADGPFQFLRATFYRWAQIWGEICPAEARAPVVLAVGDLHVENFGTWRDIEGRLVWGINDFDEVCPMPYTVDLIRLAASAHLAIKTNHLSIGTKDACDSILAGYRQGLEAGGKPIVLGEHHRWLRDVATSDLRHPVVYWEKMRALPTYRGKVPKSALRALKKLLPEEGLEFRVAHRIAGLGSLGRQRFVALANWRGAMIAREAKALAPSAYTLAWNDGPTEDIQYETVVERSVRSPDPFVHRRGRWVVRRLAPDCSRVELAALPQERDESRLLLEMGHETANVHLGSKAAVRCILPDLNARKQGWLHEASERMVKATLKDWNEWREGA